MSSTRSSRPPVWLWSSITGKLTLLYALSAAAVLLVLGALVYRLLAGSFDRLAGSFVVAEVEDIRAILRENPNDTNALVSEVSLVQTGFPNYYARILDSSGRTLIETPHMSGQIDSSTFPAAAEIERLPKKVRRWTSTAGSSYLLAAAWAPVGRDGNERRVVQMALDVSQPHAILAACRNELAVIIVIGIALSAAAGMVVTRFGLRPLADITRAAQEISPAHLDQRIVPAAWPRELYALAMAFDQMLARLEESFLRLSQFSADLAHELRTPVNNLRGELEVALGRPRSAEEYQQILESNLEECGRLSAMIEKLLFLARAESPRTQIARITFDARQALESVREFYDPLAQEQGVSVRCEGVERIFADPTLFRQAVSNLLSNALQSTPKGGTVTVIVQCVLPGWLEVSVHDTGQGVAPEHLLRIFDRFYRVDGARTNSVGGTGLGLAIVKSIMTLHGGTATMSSAVGQGTRVTLRFPIPKAPDKITETTSAAAI